MNASTGSDSQRVLFPIIKYKGFDLNVSSGPLPKFDCLSRSLLRQRYAADLRSRWAVYNLSMTAASEVVSIVVGRGKQVLCV